MKIRILITAALAFCGAAHATLDPAKPLIAGPEGTVTARDFEAQMLRIPDALRQESRASLERVATMTDTLFVNRVLAAEARKKGLLDDPLIVTRTKQIVEAYEARVYLDDFEKHLPLQNVEARAREIYLADRAKYRAPELYTVDHLLVSLWGRTPEMALDRIKVARGKLEAGGSLEEIVKEYGTEPNQRTLPTGKLGVVAAAQVDSAIGGVLPGLKLNEWSQPILTRAGYHIVRVTAKTPPRDIPFEEVKAAIVEEERGRFMKKLTDEKLQAIRNAPGTKIDAEALKELVQPLPKEELDRLHREAAQAEARNRAAGNVQR